MASKKWRVNYVVTYMDSVSVLHRRELVLETLKNLAQIKEIECKVSHAYPFVFDPPLTADSIYAQSVSDLVYFRSLPHTAISAKEFRKLVDLVFSNHTTIGPDGDYEVGSQMQKSLPKFPFPD